MLDADWPQVLIRMPARGALSAKRLLNPVDAPDAHGKATRARLKPQVVWILRNQAERAKDTRILTGVVVETSA